MSNLIYFKSSYLTKLKTWVETGIPATDLVDDISGLYQKPALGIPASDLVTAVRTSLGLADSAYQLPGTGIPATDLDDATQIILTNAGSFTGAIIPVTVQLGGYNPTSVTFQGANTAATILGTVNTATYALAVGNTFIVNPDGAGDVTWTVAGTRGTSTSNAAPSTDMTASIDTKFKIAVNGGAASTVTCDWVGGSCDSAAEIAAEMQTKVQALGGAFAAVTCAVADNKYVFTSPIYGTSSAVTITRADDHNATEELKLGVDGGVEVAGTGDAANLAAATPTECAVKLAALAGLTAAKDTSTNKIRITSDTTGAASKLAVNAASTLDTVFGITGTDYGTCGLSQAEDMADANYVVWLTPVKTSAVTNVTNVGNKATTGFDIYCETPGSTDTYDVVIFGTVAT